MGKTFYTGFHAHDGWYFERQDDGSVKISAAVDRSSEVIILTAAEWASVITSVSTLGETSETYQAAVRLHGAGPYAEESE